MPARRYAIAEAAEALDVTTQTLQRWMRTTDTDITSERDPVERRLRWLNQQQVATLAKRHHRGDLRPISRIEQHLIARLRRCEQRIEDLEALVERLQSGRQLAAPLEPSTPRPRGGVRTRPLGSVAVLPLLPEDWVACRRWGEDHGVEYWAIDRAIHGRRDHEGNLTTPAVLQMHQNEWRSRDPRPVRVTEAFDLEQQEAARRHFGK